MQVKSAPHHATGTPTTTPGHNGLQTIRIHNAHCDGELYLNGAHVTSWKPTGRDDVLWLSRDSEWENGKPIRGGVPICFPWFGPKSDDPNAPAHGFARLEEWELLSVDDHKHSTTVHFRLESSASAKAWFPGDFELRYAVTFGQKLAMSLTVENTGNDAFSIEEALHTYFNVGDVQKLTVTGLDGVSFIDKTDSNKEKTQQGNIRFTGETNRVYKNTTGAVVINDPVLRRAITVTKRGSIDTVVWNPWAERAKSIPDFADDEWPTMVCAETGNVASNAIHLKPHERHTMDAIIEVSAI